MKTFLLSLSLLLVSTMGMTQNWAPAGATWHYDFQTFWESGYVKIQYTGDTVVAGKNCKILDKSKHTYDHVEQVFSNLPIGREYTYEENNIVYYYRYGMFFKLYDFNAGTGGSWVVAGWDILHPCDSTAIVDIESTGTKTINSVTLTALKIAPPQNAAWAFSADSILERIGSLGYMFPEPACVADLYEGGSLRCYYDDSFGLYERGSAPTCDYILGIKNIKPERELVKIYPVPATTTLTVELKTQSTGIVSIVISDVSGNEIKRLETEKATTVINIGDLKAGLYFITIKDQKGVIRNQKIVKTM